MKLFGREIKWPKGDKPEVHVKIDPDKVDPELKDDKTILEKLSGILKSQRLRLDSIYKIIDKDGVVIRFKMNMRQRLLYLGLWFMNIVLKSRQHGITTFSCIFFLDTCLFNSNTQALIIAHNKDDAEEFFRNKIKFAYDNLPAEIRGAVSADTHRKGQLVFSNGSSIRVATSGRSGTYQLVHISELGKICAKYPDKAAEIKSGTLNTVHPGQIVIIESTAEGREGDFWQYCEDAQKLHDGKKKLSKLDFKFFFLPWYQNPLNVLDPADVVIYSHNKDYFDKLKVKHNVKLSPWQKAWYIKKLAQQGEDFMYREHPSTPEEAFWSAIKGAYFYTEMKNARREGRICNVKFQPNCLVNTWWDLGYNDINAIWFTQNVGREIHVIDFYQNSGEGLLHYANVLDQKAEDLKYRYGTWTAPHDIMVHEYTSGKTRLETARELGVNFKVGPKVAKESQIENTRRIFPICYFDEQRCDSEINEMPSGLTCLESYRKEWDDKRGTYRNKPYHNWASNAADAFHVFSGAHSFNPNPGFGVPDTGAMAERAMKRKRAKGWAV